MAKINILEANVALLSGGWSDEREISLDSGRACHKALKEAGFKNIDFIDVAEHGFATKLENGNYDVAFVAMHGKYGEDGCVQGLLEMLHIPYTFSGVTSSSLSAEKHIAKLVYQTANIPTPQGYEVEYIEQVTEDFINKVIDEFGFPIFVKPASNGSSYGITRVTEKSQIMGAVELALEDGDSALIEQCIEGMEITIPVIGNEEPQALEIIEIDTGSEFYDLKVKYEPAELHHICPARLDEKTYKLAQYYAVEAHKALRCEGASRSDFIVSKEGVPTILETNSIPGMTETSLLPDSARHLGIEFSELCRKFIEFAFDRFGVEYK